MSRQLSIVLVCVALAGGAWVASAGNLTPPGAPSPTMRTLDEVFNAASSSGASSGHPGFSAVDLLYNPPATSARIFVTISGVTGQVMTSGYEGSLEALTSQQVFDLASGEAATGELRLLMEFDAAMAELISRLKSQDVQNGSVHWVTPTTGGLVPYAQIDLQQATIAAVRPTPEALTFELELSIARGEYTTSAVDGAGSIIGQTTVLIP